MMTPMTLVIPAALSLFRSAALQKGNSKFKTCTGEKMHAFSDILDSVLLELKFAGIQSARVRMASRSKKGV